MPEPSSVLLGTVALEPNRWSTVHDDGRPTLALPSILDQVAAAGFDGLEVWDRHLTTLNGDELDRVLDHPVRVDIFNSYVSFDPPDSSERDAVAAWCARFGATGVKFNVGNNADGVDQYAERLAAFVDHLPPDCAALCECHHGISVAEDPAVAARIFAAAGGGPQMQAIVHTHEDPDYLRARFDAYGDRITHAHVNFLDFTTMRAPTLAEIRPELEAKVAFLTELGFVGSWTIEFVAGLLGPNDHPDALMAQAHKDLEVLREVLT